MQTILLALTVSSVASVIGGPNENQNSTGVAHFVLEGLSDPNATFVETAATSPFESKTSSLKTDPRATPLPAQCGNGMREGDEQCDDANSDDGDGCSKACIVEIGFSCSTSFSGADSCELQPVPPQGRVFVRASTKVGGISASELVGPARATFRRGIANTLELVVAQVLIETVTSRRSSRSVQVDYRVLVNDTEGSWFAQQVAAAHSDGSLVQALLQQGLNVSVLLIATPTVLDESGNTLSISTASPQHTENETTPLVSQVPPSSNPAEENSKGRQGSSTAVTAASVVVGLLVLACAAAALWQRRRRRARIDDGNERMPGNENRRDEESVGEEAEKPEAMLWGICCWPCCSWTRQTVHHHSGPASDGSDEEAADKLENGTARIPVVLMGVRSHSEQLDAVVNHGPRHSGCSEDDFKGVGAGAGDLRGLEARLEGCGGGGHLHPAELEGMAAEAEEEEDERVQWEARRVRIKVGRELLRVLRVAQSELQASTGRGLDDAAVCKRRERGEELDFDEFRRVARNGGWEPDGYGVSEREAGDEELRLVFRAVGGLGASTVAIKDLQKYLDVMKPRSKVAKGGSAKKSSFQQWLEEQRQMDEDNKGREAEEKEGQEAKRERIKMAEQEEETKEVNREEEEEAREERGGEEEEERKREERTRAALEEAERNARRAEEALRRERKEEEKRANDAKMRQLAAFKLKARAKQIPETHAVEQHSFPEQSEREETEEAAREHREEGGGRKKEVDDGERLHDVDERRAEGEHAADGDSKDDDQTEEAETAATRIQARARGVAGRRKAEREHQRRLVVTVDSEEALEGRRGGDEGATGEREAAAVKIQARARGMTGRRKVHGRPPQPTRDACEPEQQQTPDQPVADAE